MTAGLVVAGALVVLLRGRRWVRHRARAIDLGLALAPLPPTFAQAVSRGRATFRGDCTRCYGPWEACAAGCRLVRR